jgi:hypothetical protein
MQRIGCGIFVWSQVFLFVLLFRTASTFLCTDEDITCIAMPVEYQPPSKEPTADNCADKHENCKQYVERGECSINPGWMVVNCPVGCNGCHLREASVRCHMSTLNMSSAPALVAGDLNNIFQRLSSDSLGYGEVKILSTRPWIATIDNFLTPTETSALINSVSGWQRSGNKDITNSQGKFMNLESHYRTSDSAWCKDSCDSNPDVKNIVKKIQSLTNIPSNNYEAFQVLKYETGQLYKIHHDSSFSQSKLVCGTRVLTVFLYLSDVEEGGETKFPLLGIEVKPKQGRALIWPGVLNEHPAMIDSRTIHEALPVVKGVKYAANTWIHMYDFKTPNKWGCTGGFE